MDRTHFPKNLTWKNIKKRKKERQRHKKMKRRLDLVISSTSFGSELCQDVMCYFSSNASFERRKLIFTQMIERILEKHCLPQEKVELVIGAHRFRPDSLFAQLPREIIDKITDQIADMTVLGDEEEEAEEEEEEEEMHIE